MSIHNESHSSLKNYAYTIKRLGLKSGCVLEIGSRDGKDAAIISRILGVPLKDTHVVEPNPDLHNLIQTTYSNINLHKVAINDVEGVLKFNKVVDTRSGSVGQSSLLDSDRYLTQLTTEVIMVECIKGSTLLEKINKPIIACKIDVEGLEMAVIKGGLETIKANNYPPIIFETWSIMDWYQERRKELLEYVESLGYHITAVGDNCIAQHTSKKVIKWLNQDNVKENS